MSTHCFIGQQLSDGTVRGVYCHYDGDLSLAGAILARHYGDRGTVSELLDLGDLSFIGPGPRDGTSAYHRDLGEVHWPANVYPSMEDVLSLRYEWSYVQLEGGSWLYDNGRCRTRSPSSSTRCKVGACGGILRT